MPFSEAGIGLESPLLSSGLALFETMRAYHGGIFLLDRHLDRLASSAKSLGFPALDKAVLREACLAVLKANGMADARLRLTVCMDSKVIARTTVYRPSANVPGHGYNAVVSDIRRLSSSPLAGHKTTSRMDLHLARRAALAQGYDEAILLNELGNICEGSITNLFFSCSEQLLTPDTGQGLLPGITRQLIIDIAIQAGIEVRKGIINPDDLSHFEEAFATNSIVGIMPLASISSEHGMQNFCCGHLTSFLRQEYSDSVKALARTSGS